MCDQPPQSDSSGPQIIDVEFGFSTFRAGRVLIAIPLGVLGAILLALLGIAVQKWLPSNLYLLATILALPAIPAVWLYSRLSAQLTRTRVARVMAAHDQAEQTSEGASGNPFREIASEPAIRELGRLLVSQGRVGFVIRSVPECDRQEIKPLSLVFQPVPLCGRDSRFHELSSQGSGPSRAISGFASWRQRRSALLVAVFTYLGIVMVGWWAIAELVSTMRNGEVSLRLGIYLALFAFFTYAAISGRYNTSSRWVLVPGGLVVRAPRRRGDWKVHVFDPATSLLIITNQIDQWCHVYVWDFATSDALPLNRSEAELLLRNWLSNMPPPSVEELSDLE